MRWNEAQELKEGAFRCLTGVTKAVFCDMVEVMTVHGHVESPTDGQLMVPIRGEPADGSPSPAHAKAVPRQGELVLQGAGAGPSAL